MPKWRMPELVSSLRSAYLLIGDHSYGSEDQWGEVVSESMLYVTFSKVISILDSVGGIFLM